MRLLTAAMLASILLLGACTVPSAPDDTARLETSAGERAPGPATGQAATGLGAPRVDPDAPAQPGPVPAPAPGPGATVPEPARPVPPMSDPLPPEPAPERDPSSAASVEAPDRSCRTTADCAVKNVGSCCGAVPACVNANARTNPDAVQAQCAREGRSGICGFKPVESCECVRGTCTDKVAMFE